MNRMMLHSRSSGAKASWGVGFLILVMVMLNARATPPSGGSYVLPKHVVAGGGGPVSAGSFVLIGTVGQAEATAPVSAGSLVLQSGFHHPRAPAVPLPDSLFRDSFE